MSFSRSQSNFNSTNSFSSSPSVFSTNNNINNDNHQSPELEHGIQLQQNNDNINNYNDNDELIFKKLPRNRQQAREILTEAFTDFNNAECPVCLTPFIELDETNGVLICPHGKSLLSDKYTHGMCFECGERLFELSGNTQDDFSIDAQCPSCRNRIVFPNNIEEENEHSFWSVLMDCYHKKKVRKRYSESFLFSATCFFGAHILMKTVGIETSDSTLIRTLIHFTMYWKLLGSGYDFGLSIVSPLFSLIRSHFHLSPNQHSLLTLAGGGLAGASGLTITSTFLNLIAFQPVRSIIKTSILDLVHALVYSLTSMAANQNQRACTTKKERKSFYCVHWWTTLLMSFILRSRN